MLKPVIVLLATAMLVGSPTAEAGVAEAKPAAKMTKKAAAPAKAKPKAKAPAAKKATPKKAADVRASAQRTSAAAGLKMKLDLAASVKVSGRMGMPSADAVVYTNRQGAVTGVTIKSAGLPDPERLDGRSSRYVVWLMGKDGQRARRLGELESRNGARAVFGYTAESPLEGYERLVITTEGQTPSARPMGTQRMMGDMLKARAAAR